MVGILETPFLWVVATIALYGVAYWGYGKWIDRNVWRSDAKKATPAHMYMDGSSISPSAGTCSGGTSSRASRPSDRSWDLSSASRLGGCRLSFGLSVGTSSSGGCKTTGR